jgi:Uma2 family endonuclease
MPLTPHESFKRWLGRIVEILTEEMGCEIRSLSAQTWRRPDLAKGVEADECYYIQNESVIRGKMTLDLAIDPAPDLVIEVDMTSLSIPRLPIYAALAVPEVWRFDGVNIQVLTLGNGGYQVAAQSLAIPIVTAEILAEFLRQAQEIGETSWARSVRQWGRQQLATKNPL